METFFGALAGSYVIVIVWCVRCIFTWIEQWRIKKEIEQAIRTTTNQQKTEIDAEIKVLIDRLFKDYVKKAEPPPEPLPVPVPEPLPTKRIRRIVRRVLPNKEQEDP